MDNGKSEGVGQMGMFGKDARGSATIEMAVLMPMIAVLMILLIYLALYLYDRAVLYGDAYLAALRASELSEERSEEVYAKADAWFTTLKEGQLIALPEVSRELTVDAKGVRILYNGEVVVPIMAGSTIFEQWGSFCFSGDAYAAWHRPVTFIRRCRVLEELFGQNEETKNSGDAEPESEQMQ